MVESGVKIVDSKRVHTQLLHEDGIAQTDVGIGEGIFAVLGLVCALTSRLVVDTNDHQALVGDSVNKVAAANFNRVHSIGNG